MSRKSLKKMRLMHIYQHLPSLEWKLYPNVLGENWALGNHSSLSKQKYLFCLRTRVLYWLAERPYLKLRSYLRISTLFSIWFAREYNFNLTFFFSQDNKWLLLWMVWVAIISSKVVWYECDAVMKLDDLQYYSIYLKQHCYPLIK